MKRVRALSMTAEDNLIFRIYLGFLSTPLVLLVLAGMLQALAAG